MATTFIDLELAELAKAWLAVQGMTSSVKRMVIPQTGKTRITIYLDDAILERFKAQSEKTERTSDAIH